MSLFNKYRGLIVLLPKGLCLAILIIVFTSFSVYPQDPNFSQFYGNPVYFNPAMTGINGGLNARSVYRNAWPRVNSNFRYTGFSIDVEEPDIGSGFGLIAMNSSEGGDMLTTTTFGALFSHRLVIIPREFFVQAGFGGSYVQRQIDYSNLVFSDQLHPIYGDIYSTSFQHGTAEKIIYPDFSAGLSAVFNIGKHMGGRPKTTNTVGLAFHHLTRPDISFLDQAHKLPIRTVFHASSVIPLGNNRFSENMLVPGIIYENQSVSETFMFGLNFVKEPLFTGLWLRNKNFLLSPDKYESLVVLAGFTVPLSNAMRMRFGYSYDITVSKLSRATAGSHEITISIEFEEFKMIRIQNPSLRQSSRSNKECFNKF